MDDLKGYRVSWRSGGALRLGTWYPTLAECQAECDRANLEQRAADARRPAPPAHLAADHQPEPGPTYAPLGQSEIDSL